MTKNLRNIFGGEANLSLGFGTPKQGRGEANKAGADAFAEKMRPILLKLSLEAGVVCGSVVLARMLNEQGIPTARSGKWHPETVKRLLRRVQPNFDEELCELRKQKSAAFFSGLKKTGPAFPSDGDD
ncbi:recombinase family protein [Thalassospiraceae bacterium LMO-SO8]|nr:recombinase family protein [Alphaproteobacteria bacterium LMO-S08]WND77885.1 recombinase family protein [Thalassospiraceae bacterium LMO-SO8]